MNARTKFVWRPHARVYDRTTCNMNNRPTCPLNIEHNGIMYNQLVEGCSLIPLFSTLTLLHCLGMRIFNWIFESFVSSYECEATELKQSAQLRLLHIWWLSWNSTAVNLCLILLQICEQQIDVPFKLYRGCCASFKDIDHFQTAT